VVRLLDSRDPRWWAAIGGAAGIGLAAKWNIGFLLAALLLGFACTPAARPLLRSRYLALGAVLALVLAAPDFAWQAAHGWPNLEVFRALDGDAGANRLMYWPGQVLYTSIVLVPLWVRGAAWSLRSARFRPLGIAVVTVICLQFVLGGKTYYPGGGYTFLFAAGAASLSASAPGLLPLRRRLAVYGVGLAICSVISLPLLPAAALARFPVQKINYDLGEEIGWPAQVQLLARVYQSLPASERERTTLVTANYGEAGAVARYGPALGLPVAYCGQNNFWLWGPPPAADTTAVVIGVSPALLHREFSSVRQVAVWNNGLGVDDDEQDTPVYVVTGRLRSWAAAWPAFRHYS
jgi:hypothetical protein